MQTITIEITGNNALQALQKLEHDNQIRILKRSDINLAGVPGKSLSEEDFKKWVELAEDTDTISVNEAKQQWEVQNKKLRKVR